jgi:hypothetical protein
VDRGLPALGRVPRRLRAKGGKVWMGTSRALERVPERLTRGTLARQGSRGAPPQPVRLSKTAFLPFCGAPTRLRLRDHPRLTGVLALQMLKQKTPALRRGFLFGAPGETRTPDQVVRSHLLYPTELRVQNWVDSGKAGSQRTHMISGANIMASPLCKRMAAEPRRHQGLCSGICALRGLCWSPVSNTSAGPKRY